MSIKIVGSLENLIKILPEVKSIMLLDLDGVPIACAGEEVRNKNQYSASYSASLEQARKLGLGSQKFWAFCYEYDQIVLLNVGQFVVVIIASSKANTGVLCSLEHQLEPILRDCAFMIDRINSNTNDGV